MSQRRHIWLVALVMVLAMVAAACGGDDPATPGNGGGGDELKGGTLRYESEEFGFTSGFDPSGEYLGNAWGIMSNMLMRGLTTYKHVGGAEGNTPVPDLATGEPEISSD
ncbi:MAG: hypothetical protein QOH26_1772, partial [Actinomycetota bacterium]|nr:hypothetical protein [Actinomycetota bacterium]